MKKILSTIILISGLLFLGYLFRPAINLGATPPLTTFQGGTGTSTWQGGSIPIYNSSGRFAEDHSGLYYDLTNHILYSTTTSIDTALIADSILTGTNGAVSWDLTSLTLTGSLYVPDLYPDNVYVTNKLGIGTSTPFAALSINATQGLSSFAIGSSSGQTLLVDSFGNLGLATTAPASRFSIGGLSRATNPLFLVSTSTANSTSTAFIIDSNGRLGIGTTSPQSTLSVVGNLDVTASTTVEGTLATKKIFSTDTTNGLIIGTPEVTNSTALTLSGGVSTMDLTTINSTAACLRMTLNNNYNAGPAFQLCPNATGFGGLYFDAGASVNNNINFRDAPSGNSSMVIQQATAGGILLQKQTTIQPLNGVAANTVPLSITSVNQQTGNMLNVYSPSQAVGAYLVIGANGRVGIASSTPAARLSVAPSQGEVVFLVSTSTLAATSTAFIIDSNGRIGVGTTSPRGVATFVGDIYYDGHLVSTATKPPTVTAGGGTNPFVIGADGAGRINVGSGAPGTTITITFAKTNYTNAPACVVGEDSSLLSGGIKAQSTLTTLVITTSVAGFSANDTLDYICQGF